VTERDYWQRLEFRLCRELEGMEENSLRFLWCDGFIPQQYLVDDPDPRITGLAWICNGPRQARWEFTLLLDHTVSTREDIQWDLLLPPDEVTGWLAVDLDGHRIRLTPSHALTG
jgi:hypothetical protein